ncbi:ribosomal protein S2 [Piedraia hortae CBS 480.64]|uniref:Ribosomal protein S2 n=1 Tax=Piedraia hortae CBS 480.64 TaxID=1314780 RepID=A0A6A7BRA6_9PEZI|nr:ribosomal protein S2 [Piedraia hortae CBS 480.64]
MIVRPLRLCNAKSEAQQKLMAIFMPPSPANIGYIRRWLSSEGPPDTVKQDWEFFQFQKRLLDPIGSQVAPHYRPHELLSRPPRAQDVSLELLMASQAHLGHATGLWHPANAKYIYGVRGETDPIHIIALDTTAAHLRRAAKVVKGVCEQAGLVLFVGSRPGQARAVVNAAELAGGCHLFTKWTPGTITNRQHLLHRCQKKAVDNEDQEVACSEDELRDHGALKPDLVVCLNPLENYVLLHECALNNIPTVGIIDTDCNPAWVTYPIPANDDSLRSVYVIAAVLGQAGKEGRDERIRRERMGADGWSQNYV